MFHFQKPTSQDLVLISKGGGRRYVPQLLPIWAEVWSVKLTEDVCGKTGHEIPKIKWWVNPGSFWRLSAMPLFNRRVSKNQVIINRDVLFCSSFSDTLLLVKVCHLILSPWTSFQLNVNNSSQSGWLEFEKQKPFLCITGGKREALAKLEAKKYIKQHLSVNYNFIFHPVRLNFHVKRHNPKQTKNAS